MGFFSEFRQFAIKGNVVDLAVGVVIGGAFGKIVTSLVGDLVMPAVGLLSGGIDFSKMTYTVSHGLGGKEAVIKYGAFVQSIVDFFIVAMAIFLAVKAINRFKARLDAAAGPPTPTETLLTEIRDLLKQGGTGQRTP